MKTRSQDQLPRLTGSMHADRRSFARLALGFDGAAMQLRDVFHDREAQAGSAQLAAAPFIGAIETLEDARQIALREFRCPRSATLMRTRSPVDRRPQGNHAAGLRIFHRVIEQIVDDFLKPALVCLQQRQIPRKHRAAT